MNLSMSMLFGLCFVGVPEVETALCEVLLFGFTELASAAVSLLLVLLDHHLVVLEVVAVVGYWFLVGLVLYRLSVY